jgi:hypothetical protein
MKKSVSIIGGGPSSLLLAAFLDPLKFDITIYEKSKSVGRKFLVAGKGGFNLTHSEPIAQLIKRYTPYPFLEEALGFFNNTDLRHWLNKIGIPTYIGSSNRVYPEKGIKPIQVLNAILAVLKTQNVALKYNYIWTGWSKNNTLLFNTNTEIQSDLIIFALGGGSWKVTGSDGSWLESFKTKGINTVPFQASNCAYRINWASNFISKHEGSPLKNIAISCLNKSQKGEVVLTRFGLEGNAIYALSPQIKKELNDKQKASIFIDLKPALNADEVLLKIKASTLRNTTEILRKSLKLGNTQIAILKQYVPKEEFLNSVLLVQHIKNLHLKITDTAPINDAISTTGGVHLNAIDKYFQLKSITNQYCIGEMLDWDTPTGGYLLQGCFSMSAYLAKHLNEKH